MTHPTQTLLTTFRAIRVIPVIRTRTARFAVAGVTWLRDAGLSAFGIIMATPDASALIRHLASDPSLPVGGGTEVFARQFQADRA